METNDNERSTLFTARSTENAMTFFKEGYEAAKAESRSQEKEK